MKKVLLFIGLKVVEVSGFIFIPYYIGSILAEKSDSIIDIWAVGFFTIGAGIAVLIMLGLLVCGNWALVKRITGDE
jgi:hypothetical protein